MDELCRIYWKPVYGFLRRSGYSREDAEDLTQSYFERLLKKGSFVDRSLIKGKLRSFLLGGLKRHLVDDLRFKNAAKRGGGQKLIPIAASELDLEEETFAYVAPPSEELSPDRLFDQSWALSLLACAHEKLRSHYQIAGKIREYELLKPAIAVADEVDTARVAEELGVEQNTVRVMVFRLRRHFRDRLCEEIAETLADRKGVDDELAYLMEVFS